MLKVNKKRFGFTIVELLVVIVVIGILAAITIVSYTAITSRAVASSLQSDLNNASTKLKAYNVLYGSYPTVLNSGNSFCPSNPDVVDNNYCLKTSNGNEPEYYSNDSSNPQSFVLLLSNTNGTVYRISNESEPKISNNTRISCLAILNANESTGDGIYWITPNGTEFLVFCDMTTDGGGWTIVTAQSGTTTGQLGLLDNTELTTNNPLLYKQYNLNLTKKEDVSVVSTESLIKRNTGVWIKANHALFDENLVGAGDQHPHWQVTVTASNGSTSTNSQMGYSNYSNSNGGDFGITTSGVVFDHHNTTTYHHLRSSCTYMYFYNYGTTYNVNTALGSWSVTHACTNSGLQMGGWYAATR